MLSKRLARKIECAPVDEPASDASMRGCHRVSSEGDATAHEGQDASNTL
jgi:hypothetical protein